MSNLSIDIIKYKIDRFLPLRNELEYYIGYDHMEMGICYYRLFMMIKIEGITIEKFDEDGFDKNIALKMFIRNNIFMKVEKYVKNMKYAFDIWEKLKKIYGGYLNHQAASALLSLLALEYDENTTTVDRFTTMQGYFSILE